MIISPAQGCKVKVGGNQPQYKSRLTKKPGIMIIHKFLFMRTIENGIRHVSQRALRGCNSIRRQAALGVIILPFASQNRRTASPGGDLQGTLQQCTARLV